LQPVRTFRVSGQLAGSDVPENGLMLALENDDILPMAAWRPLPAAVTLTDASGRFAFLRVPAGHYRIRTRISPGAVPANGAGEQLFVDMPVDVAGDLDDVVATASRPTSIHGTIRFEGTSPPPDPNDAIQLFFTRADAGAGAGGSPSTIASGQTFRSAPLMPGEYLLGARFMSGRFAGGGQGAWRLKDAIVDGRDITDLPIAVGAGDLGNIAVTFTDVARPEISGHVRDQSGKPDAEASVLIFSADSRYWSHTASWGIPLSGRAQVALTSRLGAYEFSSLPAGEYFLVAVPDSDDAWTVIGSPNPELFAKLATRAVHVTVKDGDRLVHDLQTLR
jgi:protocatechuate 3,4-dioxygenase beta subunit